MSFKTPVLFLIFNQPEITIKTFSKIARIKPTTLYISADGPRKGCSEEEECELTRSKVLSMINWDCDVHKRFLSKNVGCKEAVSTGISWFLEEQKEGIILEYDCVPSQSFFYFCEKMLSRYRDDVRIFSISGTNYQFGKSYGDGDYYYSRIPSVWGWATWERAWKHWDGSISNYPESKKMNVVESYFKCKKTIKFWNKKFLQIYNNLDDTWGLPWVFAVFKNNGLCVSPNKNLITNIGFSKKATHAKDLNDVHSNLKRFELENFVSPSIMVPVQDADEKFSRDLSLEPINVIVMHGIRYVLGTVLPKRVYFFLRRLFRKYFRGINE